MSDVRRVLFVANGHGETAIAARIAREVRAAGDAAQVLDLLPLVGLGTASAPLALVGPRRNLPSGGLVAMGNVRAFCADLRAGFAGLLARQLAFLAGARGRYDVVVAVGDVYALALALRAHAPTVFVGTAKSDYVAPYGPFERSVMKRAVRTFVRDEPTAARLARHGVRAEAPGNVIVDLVRSDGVAPPGKWLGILPGSRTAAYEDGVRLARVVRACGAIRTDFGALLSIAPTLDAAGFARALAADGWSLEAAPAGTFTARAGSTRLLAWRAELGGLLAAVTAVVGQAGTANEQAAGCGIPVVALEGPGARKSDWYRMRQRRLLGEALLLVPMDPAEGGAALADLLSDPARLRRMSEAGRSRMGPPGGAVAIARAIVTVAA